MVRSAGTHALTGNPMESTAADRVLQNGGIDSGFIARQLNEATLEGVDFVLAMTEEHRTAVVGMSPKMLKRAYTIREFAEILDEISSDPLSEIPAGNDPESRTARWTRLRQVALLKRHGARTRLNDVLDIEDPYRRGDAAFDAMVSDLNPLLQSIARFEAQSS